MGTGQGPAHELEGDTMADKQHDDMADRGNAPGQDRKQSLDDATARFEQTFGVSAKGLDRDAEAMNRLSDMVAEADKLRATAGAGTTATYDALRAGQPTDQPAQPGTGSTSDVHATADVGKG